MDVRIEPLSASDLAAYRDDLVRLLRSCVDAGGSLGYLSPMPESEAVEFWRTVEQQVASGNRIVLVARDGLGIVGTAQLALETKPNGRHRAEVLKVMVAPSHRRRGIAGRLMSEIENQARAHARRLLFLDTAEGASGAKRFYESIGYTYAGGIPDYALDPEGRSTQNAYYFKRL
jgi:acetyltransferase